MPFQIVLIDAQMPEMDGFALAEKLKEAPEYAGLALVMLSSAGHKGDAERCGKLGIAEYLTKPVKQSELRNVILRLAGAQLRKNDETSTRKNNQDCYQILLAEDNAVNQFLAVRLLEKAGHTVALALNGREAITALEQRSFDLVLMDLQMPEMSGYEATAVIRDRERLEGGHIPIVALTAHAMKGDRERCIEAGMDGYIAKPIKSSELYAIIEELLSARRKDGLQASSESPFESSTETPLEAKDESALCIA